MHHSNGITGIAFKKVSVVFCGHCCMASGISAHAGVSRLMYVMGRDGVIKKYLVISARNYIHRLIIF
jgi:amino acid transporter